MAKKEALARIKINKLLEEAGWKLIDDNNGKANVVFENNVKITEQIINALGENYEKTKNGFIDFLLLDNKGFPFIVLEAKSEDKNPLIGKEQARRYAKSQNCRFVILSNGNLHYFWDVEHGNPNIITDFPSPDSVNNYKKFAPDKNRLVSEKIDEDYIALTQYPNYSSDPEYIDESTRKSFFSRTKIRFLRYYQKNAVKSIQKAVSEKKERFLFEMATGTGKTLTSAAVVKMFLRTGNARRILFLVDRLELEDQAKKAFNEYLHNDFKTVVYKENRDDWRKAEIVVTTVQSLLFNNKYKSHFSPTDFDMVISDEAHRSIGGNARAVFEYFIGYKLGLTATPKDYLKKFDSEKEKNDPREFERRLLLDTYRTFGCEAGEPTFRYSLLDGVKDGFLINPTVVDARTEITTQLLSDKGYSVLEKNEDKEEEETYFFQRDFEKKFFSEKTNIVFCKSFLQNALRDPVSNEIGKTIIFAVSQNHASKIAQILNIVADKLYPGKYNSDFAVQVTSVIPDAQQMTINFTDKSNNLNGTGNFIPEYKTSKTRVSVTVGMMTTGYDCTDILNICLMRPIFSPQDFIQIKGRGTRKHNFSEQLIDNELKAMHKNTEKTTFKLFDFFANCEYFEEKFNYDEILKLPRQSNNGGGSEPPTSIDEYEIFKDDKVLTFKEHQIGYEGMKIDRMFFNKFEDEVKNDDFVNKNVREGKWDTVLNYINEELMNKPEEYYTLEKLRKSAEVDRRLSLREIIEKIFGLIPKFKSKDELLDEEFSKFISDFKPNDNDNINALKYFFKAYITDNRLRDIIEKKKFNELNVNPSFNINDYKSVGKNWRMIIPEYVKDYVTLNKFM